VIVDPSADEVMAVSHPMCRQHPLHHAVMVAVDLVGKSQSGGAYTYNGKVDCTMTPSHRV
jgi:hypothetical protein